jgi:hypothetical protein
VKPRSATTARLPDFVEPMKAKLVRSMPSGNWIYEIKFDGYRALALRGGSETRLLSRSVDQDQVASGAGVRSRRVYGTEGSRKYIGALLVGFYEAKILDLLQSRDRLQRKASEHSLF